MCYQGEGDGEKDKGEETGLQRTWFDEVSDNVARFDGAGNPIAGDEWLNQFLYGGNTKNEWLNLFLNGGDVVGRDRWVRERFLESNETVVIRGKS